MTKPGFALLSASVLVASLLANAALFRASLKYYKLFNRTSLDPLGLSAHPQGLPPRAAKPRVVIVGDSRAGGLRPLDLPSVQVINRAVSGQTTAQVLGRFQQHVANLEPDVVVIQVGINDLKAIPLFPAREREIVANCKDNLKQLVSRSRAADAHVIITTIIPAGDVPLIRMPFWPPAVDQAVQDCNAALTHLTSQNVALLDTAAIVSGPDGRVQRTYQRNFLHLNHAGNQAVNRELTRLIQSIMN